VVSHFPAVDRFLIIGAGFGDQDVDDAEVGDVSVLLESLTDLVPYIDG